MTAINAKTLLAEAKTDEKEGRKHEASAKYATIGIQLRKRDRLEEAKVFLDRAIKLSTASARVYLQAAIVQSLLGLDSEAKKSMAKFTRLAIRKKKIREYLPYVKAQLDSIPVLRKQFFLELLQLDRTDSKPFVGLAQSYAQMNRPEKAKKAFSDALRTKTHEREVIEHLRSLLKSIGDDYCLSILRSYQAKVVSLEDLCLALSDTREEPAREVEEPVYDEPSARSEEKELDVMIRELEQVIGVDDDHEKDTIGPLVKEFRKRSDSILSDDSKTRLDMAVAFFEMGLVKDAQEEIAPIKETDPVYIESRLLLGEIFMAESSYLSALSVFQQCLRDGVVDDYRHAAMYHLIGVYLKLGDRDKAYEFACGLEKLDSGYRDVRQIRGALEAQGKSSSAKNG